jgi:hypothetical protein
MPETHVDTPTGVASAYEGAVRLCIGAPSVRAAAWLVNPHLVGAQRSLKVDAALLIHAKRP